MFYVCFSVFSIVCDHCCYLYVARISAVRVASPIMPRRRGESLSGWGYIYIYIYIRTFMTYVYIYIYTYIYIYIYIYVYIYIYIYTYTYDTDISTYITYMIKLCTISY